MVKQRKIHILQAIIYECDLFKIYLTKKFKRKQKYGSLSSIEEIDETPPSCIDVNVLSATEIDLQFNEPLDDISAEDASNYTISPSLTISQANLDDNNSSIVHLSLADPMSNGAAYTLIIENIEDLEGNLSLSQSFDISYLIGETPEKGDVILTEIFPDPSPSVGLPSVEFIEIFNASNKIFDLSGLF